MRTRLDRTHTFLGTSALDYMEGRSIYLHSSYIGNYGNHLIDDFGPSRITTNFVENYLLLLKITKI